MTIEALGTSHPAVADRRSRPFVIICSVAALIAAGLLVYSQTDAFASDEGFHLLAAQLIKAGKRPYLDFFFPQAALNAYWTAAWFRVFGDTWRTAHVLAALLTAGAILLTADYVYLRFPIQRWRLAAALTATLLFGLNIVVVEFGTVAQAYGLCLFLIVAAFRVAIVAVDRNRSTLSGVAGFLAGAAAGSSLLTAPVAPVLLIWSLVQNRAGARWKKSAAFIAGTIVAFLPLLWLFMKSPRQVLFNVIDFHLFYRQVQWSGAIPHDVDVMLSWLDSSQALLLGLLAAAGLLFVFFQSDWDRRLRAELYLCSWITLGLAAHISSAHPTFERYFIFVVPFLSILATAGLYSIASKLYRPDRPFVPALALAILLSLAVGKAVYDGRDDRKWQDYEKIARKIDQVTPVNGRLFADEHFYFITRRTPPSGMEHANSHKLELPASKAAGLHIVPGSEVSRQIKTGVFDTIQTCDDEDYMKKMGLPGPYKNRVDLEECTIFWR